MSATLAPPEHLGGFTPGGDPATWYTRLWRDLAAGRVPGVPPVRSMLDVGAGEGLAVAFFAMLGVDAVGVEGVSSTDDRLVEHDYTTGPYNPARRFDLGWCCEFAEHVDQQFEDNWLVSFRRCDVVLFTHGEPGQDGWHHVNLRYAPYWAKRFDEHGFDYDDDLTAVTRTLAAVNPSPWNHYRRSGLAFRRRLRVA